MNLHFSGRRLFAPFVVGGATLLLLAGCFTGISQKTARSSSVVSYLYPNESNPVPPTGIPVLRIPLRVGIAFVPSGTANDRGGYVNHASGMSELLKNTLLQRVAAEFKSRDYIESIEIVPSTYLRPGGSFENLEQVRRMLNFDVIALVAYDQVQFTNENVLSLAYWTIAGAYVFHGNRNDTQTLLEAAVYDIPSRRLLFRAPGGSQVRASSTLVDIHQRLREDSGKSFEQATDELINNLKVQLDDFRARVRQSPDSVAKIERKPGYTGSGGFEGGFVIMLALLALARAVAWRR